MLSDLSLPTQAMTADARVAPICAGPSAAVLNAITDARIGLALWWRRPCPLLATAARVLLGGPAFCHEAQGEPAEIAGLLPQAVRPLGADIARLAALFTALSGAAAVRVRLEHARDRTCPRLHVDAVGLRLLCTYAGRGTEWQDAAGVVRRMPPGHVAVFKGTRWPDAAPRVPHRSPGVSDLPPDLRARLLLCIDALDLN